MTGEPLQKTKHGEHKFSGTAAPLNPYTSQPSRNSVRAATRTCRPVKVFAPKSPRKFRSRTRRSRGARAIAAKAAKGGSAAVPALLRALVATEDTDDCASWDWKYRGLCLEHSQSAPGRRRGRLRGRRRGRPSRVLLSPPRPFSASAPNCGSVRSRGLDRRGVVFRA